MNRFDYFFFDRDLYRECFFSCEGRGWTLNLVTVELLPDLWDRRSFGHNNFSIQKSWMYHIYITNNWNSFVIPWSSKFLVKTRPFSLLLRIWYSILVTSYWTRRYIYFETNPNFSVFLWKINDRKIFLFLSLTTDKKEIFSRTKGTFTFAYIKGTYLPVLLENIPSMWRI